MKIYLWNLAVKKTQCNVVKKSREKYIRGYSVGSEASPKYHLFRGGGGPHLIEKPWIQQIRGNLHTIV